MTSDLRRAFGKRLESSLPHRYTGVRLRDSGLRERSFIPKDFSKDRRTSSAVIREFEIIGEAVGKVPDDIKQAYPDVEWQDI